MLAAVRVDEVLTPEDEAWLADHLEYCDACAAVAAAFETQHGLLAGLRTIQPQPPRDLWARTSAAIEAERGRRVSPVGWRRRPGPPRPANRFGLAPLVALVAIVMVVGAGLLNGFPLTPAVPAGPTPILVAAAADIQVLTRDSAGNVQLLSRPLDQVCPVGAPACGVQPTFAVTAVTGIGSSSGLQGALSPTGRQMVVVSRDVGNEGVYIVPVKATTMQPAIGSGAPASSSLRTSSPAGQTAAVSSSPPSPVRTASLSPSPSATVAVATKSPISASRTPEAPPTASTGPVTTVAPASAAAPSDAMPTAGHPSAEAQSGQPSLESSSPSGPDALGSVPSPQVTPEPDAAIQIASGVTVLGTPIYAPDGLHLAFTAMPSDGSAGPDIYVWTAGDTEARAITFDHGTWLAGWTANGILASRVANGIPSTYLLDPVLGYATAVGAPGTWLPAVSPDGTMAAWWSGSMKLAADGLTWVPDTGNLVLGSWPNAADATPQILATGPLVNWQVRWADDEGSLAVWTDPLGNGQGGWLSLYRVMAFTHYVDLANPMLNAEPANPDFSLRTGRLAWTTPVPGEPQASQPPEASQVVQSPGAVASTASPVVPPPPVSSASPVAPQSSAVPQLPQVVQVLAWSGDAIGRLEVRADASGTVVP